ncbi:MAG: beta-ketoacyl synthase N-terminal-like domain-containing protein [Cyanobacteria bacterium J06576_12]
MSFEPVAIIGMSCRFPGANDLNAYWQLLKQGKTAISDIPDNRWDIERYYDEVPMLPGKMYARKGGFLRHIDQFDAGFFGISAKEAQCMDPQQRILLESAWNALEDAAIAPHTLVNTQTGVFVGISTYDYNRLISQEISEPTAYVSTGCNLGIAANRISYALSLKGPSLAIDTACSSALVAIHHACRSLATQESSLCLVGGVNAILSREPNITFSQAQALSSDDCCAPFSSKANGYVRGEGCGVIILKRLAEAQKDGDRIQSVIRGSAINHNGLTSGLTAPNGPAQQAVIRQALSVADINPTQVSYVETHAVGTAMGDAIEMNALKAVLTEDRAAEQTCWIGTNKPNIGHLEAASGMANLIKVVLALHHQQIPPHPDLAELNPYIKIDKTPLEISTTLRPWRTESETRIAGVSSFGFGGANAHIVVEEAFQKSVALKGRAPNPDTHSQPERPLQLLTLSAKSEAALQVLSQQYRVLLKNTPEEKIADVCFTANVGRAHFDYRLALVAESSSQFSEPLQAFSQQQKAQGVYSGYLAGKQSPTLVFNFIDAGSLTAVPSSELYETQPIFRKALERCEAILKLYLDPAFLEILYPTKDAESVSLLSQHPYKQLTQFCWGFALSEVLRAWGIQPTVVTGQGAGTYIAACINGSLSLEVCLEQLAGGLRSEFESSENDRTQHTNAVHLEISPKHISDWATLLQAVGRLYTQGVSVDWARFDQGYARRKVALPLYPWQRQRYWFTDTPVSDTQAANTPVLPQTDSELGDQLISQPTANPVTAKAAPQVSSNSSQARELIDWLRDYASTRINSRLIDERRCIPPHIVLDFGDRGLFGLQVSSEYDGLGLNTRDTLSIIEQLGAIDQTLTLLVGNHNALGIRPIMNWATEDVRQSLLPNS